jgi:ABC-type uncharacterized transport system permease subunit
LVRKDFAMETWGIPLAIAINIYVAVCFAFIAKKYGKNPILYGVLSILSPINLVILGYWAFSPTGNTPHAAGGT